MTDDSLAPYKARRGVQGKFKVKSEGETLRALDPAKGSLSAP